MLLSVFCDHVFNIKGYANHVRLTSDCRHQINWSWYFLHKCVRNISPGGRPNINKPFYLYNGNHYTWEGMACVLIRVLVLKKADFHQPAPFQSCRTIGHDIVFLSVLKKSLYQTLSISGTYFVVGYMIGITLKLHGGLYQYEKNIDLVYHQLMSNTVHLLYQVILIIHLTHMHTYTITLLLAPRSWYRIYTFISISITSRN